MNYVQTTPAKTQRLQVELSTQRIEELQRLMSASGIETRKELINNALSLMEWAIEEVQKGNEIVSLNKHHKKYEVLRMPSLMQAAKFAAANRSQRIEDLREGDELPDMTKMGLTGHW